MSSPIAPAPAVPTSRKLIAPLWHTVLTVALLLVPLVIGVILQTRQNGSDQVLSSHSAAMTRFYIPVLIFEWLLVLFVWYGIRKTGTTLSDLIGGTWKNWKAFALDFSLGLTIWIAMLTIGYVLGRTLGPSDAKGTSVLFPQGALETVIWVAVALTAGFVEELVYRGYLQMQFARFGFPVSLAVVAQAVVFSLGHVYEGRNAVVTITAYALFFGLIAAWRKSLRPGMIGHAWYDAAVIFLIPR